MDKVDTGKDSLQSSDNNRSAEPDVEVAAFAPCLLIRRCFGW